MKVLVAFDTKYGNTETVAKKIVEGLKSAEDIEVTLSNMKKVDFKKLDGYDAMLMGCPTHFGGPTRGAKKFIDKLEKLDLKGKKVAVFDTYIKEDFEKSVKKMEERINEKTPGLQLLLPGLSIQVEDMKGPILEEELPKCREFGKRVATQLTS
ncbi:MAG: flavodoxin family protein [Candidatus Thorarchaeota archaeon]|jgi:flavodoxin